MLRQQDDVPFSEFAALCVLLAAGGTTSLQRHQTKQQGVTLEFSSAKRDTKIPTAYHKGAGTGRRAGLSRGCKNSSCNLWGAGVSVSDRNMRSMAEPVSRVSASCSSLQSCPSSPPSRETALVATLYSQRLMTCLKTHNHEMQICFHTKRRQSY